MAEEKKLSQKTLNTTFWRWWYGNLTCFSHEHMQTFGYMWAMLAVIKELYPDDHKKQEKIMETYHPFFNTEPEIGGIVVGITCGLEEARANGAEGIDDEMINGIRAGLMGPLAGIGDSLIVGTYIPILLGIAIGLAEGGSPIGPIFYILVWNITEILFEKWVFKKGYELGGTAVDVLVGDQATAFRDAVMVLGQVIVGAMAASWVSISSPIVIAQDSTGADVTLISRLDGAFPGLLTCAFVIFAWWLQAHKNMSAVKVLLLYVVIGFVGSVIGLLGS
ncbi:PTS system mannose/fructose/sorbose family transporter subunit IID [Catenisphaera adipataccumulans]|jgi:mannose/fructose/N-acetylgalactosamine-specific phosphotransferase system component IID|uniref:PTS system fructose-specific IID component n=1 Tax=Catenisphaera adipataccumulans TaxID=700500 RepID=A0A7W8CXK2_9FIRM|nr:PTS system mannose/fructose/sorbose family transporter subunit IID [Catenisphaera adipataccumulans]MBB5183426.1 PTS system fructose-specific IID component [Catenisphaera adipataccumulans]